jgi:hypothetical protein
LSMLFHQKIGAVLVASMTEYQMIEISNQQTHRDLPHMTLTPRIECAGTETYTSLNDLAAKVTATASTERVSFDAHGQLQTASHKPVSTGDVKYHLTYALTKTGVEIGAAVEAGKAPSVPLRFILPVISKAGETVEVAGPWDVSITKPGGRLTVHTDAPSGFEAVPKQRTFNLVPGFECVPLTVAITPGTAIKIQLTVG